MKAGLQFNICNLETSHLQNDDVHDLAERVKKYVPEHLLYACRFWGDHLTATEHSWGQFWNMSNIFRTSVAVLVGGLECDQASKHCINHVITGVKLDSGMWIANILFLSSEF
jgi:hypothetical protein